MSRSYKKHPYWGQKKTNKDTANRKVRRRTNSDFDLVVNGGLYKKLFEQYDISDYGCTWSFARYLSYYRYNKADGLYYDESYINGYSLFGKYTRKQLYIRWYAEYKRK
jgi:hypothetical protein